MKKIFLKRIECRYCHRIFYICQSCWRGHCYCSEACRRENRRQHHNKSQQRYQQTKKGKTCHRRLERERRIRQSNKKKRRSFFGSTFLNPSILKHRVRYNKFLEAFRSIPNHKIIKKIIKNQKTVDDRGSTEPCENVIEYEKVFCARRCCHFCGKSGQVVLEFPHRGYGGKYSEPVFANSP